jgi:hypothetical protein
MRATQAALEVHRVLEEHQAGELRRGRGLWAQLGAGRDASDGMNTRSGKSWLPTLAFMALWMLVGVGLSRIIFFREFGRGAADIAGAVIGLMAHVRLAAREPPEAGHGT